MDAVHLSISLIKRRSCLALCGECACYSGLITLCYQKINNYVLLNTTFSCNSEVYMTEQIRYLTPGWRDEAERRLKSELSVYNAGELLICAMQYACPEEGIGFRYENPVLIHPDRCEPFSVFPLSVDEIK